MQARSPIGISLPKLLELVLGSAEAPAITRNSGELVGVRGLWRAYFADSMVGVFREVQQKA
jgi:hypothetical protein